LLEEERLSVIGHCGLVVLDAIRPLAPRSLRHFWNDTIDWSSANILKAMGAADRFGQHGSGLPGS
jgi:hypothetical protein